MKRGFIRGVWGIYDNSHRLLARRQKIDAEIDAAKNNKFGEPFTVFVLGEDNLKRLQDKGFDCIMVHKEPYMFDLIKYQYRHKMEIIRYAMEESGYDELIWLDWDCYPVKKIPSDFWEQCAQKAPFQACLQIYHKKKCYWRPSDQRKVPNGGFLYIRDKTIPSRAIKLWDTIPQDNDEPAWAKMTDEMMGGWTNTEINMKKYWDNFETMFCKLHKSSPYPPELLQTKDTCFIHYQG